MTEKHCSGVTYLLRTSDRAVPVIQVGKGSEGNTKGGHEKAREILHLGLRNSNRKVKPFFPVVQLTGQTIHHTHWPLLESLRNHLMKVRDGLTAGQMSAATVLDSALSSSMSSTQTVLCFHLDLGFMGRRLFQTLNLPCPGQDFKSHLPDF